MHKEIREIIEEAERQGWRAKLLKSGHTMMLAPDGIGKATLPGSPSDHHGLRNALSRMRQSGFKWKGR